MTRARRPGPPTGTTAEHRSGRHRAVLGSILLLGATACGGGTATTEEQQQAGSWAGDVCAAFSQWRVELATVRSSLADPAGLTATELRSTAADVEAATEDLVDDLDALGAPETDAGQWARQQLGALSDVLTEQRQVVRDTVRQEPSGLAQLFDAASAVTGAVATMLRETRETLGTLERQGDGSEQLSRAFADAPECEDVRSAP